jgi:DNA-binding Lrp family transcriptional regulator
MASKHQDIQRQIVGILSRSGKVTVSAIAKTLGIRQHTVRYQLMQLLESKAVVRSVLTNERAAGLHVFNFFFDLPQEKAKGALAFLQTRSEVTWLTRNAGPRRYEATIAVNSYAGLERLFQALGTETGTHLREPIVAIESELRHWGLRFLTGAKSAPATVHFTIPAVMYEPDTIDMAIIRRLRAPGPLAISHLADTLSISQSTVKYRIEKLQRAEVTSEDLYFIQPNLPFVQAQMVFNLKSRSAEHEQRIVAACEDNPHVENLITGLGCWDYKMVIRAESTKQLYEVEESLLQATAKSVARCTLYLRKEVMPNNQGDW